MAAARGAIGADSAQNGPAAQRHDVHLPREGRVSKAILRSCPLCALQIAEAMEPGPFPPQGFGPRLLQAPKPLPACLGVVAAALPPAAAPLVAAVPERSDQVGLCAPDQRDALTERNRQPLFERVPSGKASFAVTQFLLSFAVIRRPEMRFWSVILRRERSEPRRTTAGAPQPHPSRAASRPPQGEEERASNLILAARFCDRALPRHCKKALPNLLPPKGGRRSADKRIHRSPPRRRQSLPAYAARALYLLPPPLAGED
jgi:hypothetical protein